MPGLMLATGEPPDSAWAIEVMGAEIGIARGSYPPRGPNGSELGVSYLPLA